MQPRSTENRALHRFAVFVACSTFFLIIAGGLVTSTDSGLAVPDWPLSYGQLMPPMVGGIFYEHGHRMVATFVGFLTTILAFWLWRREERVWVRTLGWIALGAVIVQGLLGGLTVLLLLPPAVSVLHAALAQSFFCLTIVLAMVTSPSWERHDAPEFPLVAKTRRLAILTTAAIFLQLILGAIMRHTYSGLAIPDFPLSYGGIIPPMSSDQMEFIREFRYQYDLGQITLGQIWIHFAHRIGALLVVLAILTTAGHVFSSYRNVSQIREPVLLMVTLMVVQIFLGAATVWSGKGVEITTGHVATGALLLGLSVMFVARCYHLYRLPEREIELTMAPQAAKS